MLPLPLNVIGEIAHLASDIVKMEVSYKTVSSSELEMSLLSIFSFN